MKSILKSLALIMIYPFAAKDGMTYPAKTKVTREKFLPEDLQWIVVAD